VKSATWCRPVCAEDGASGYVYPGGELAAFEHAVHWKAYCGRRLSPWIAGDVLEVGAGVGSALRALCNSRVNRWLAVEPDAAMADELRRRLVADPAPAPATVVTGRLADVDDVLAFDCVLYVDVLEHIAADRDELARAAESLRPGGALVVLAPAHSWLFSPFDRAVGHFRRYSASSLRAIVPSQLREHRVFYLDSVGLLASLGNRLLLRKSMPGAMQIRLWDSCIVRVSSVLDPLTCHAIGKTVVGVWQRPR